MKNDLNEELQESVLVREGERSMKISKQRAIVKTLIAKTLKGDARAATTLLTMIHRLDPREEALPADEPLGADDVEILDAFRKRCLASADAALVAASPVEGAGSAPASGDEDDRPNEGKVDSEPDGDAS